MLSPEDRDIYACRTCHDFRHVYTGNRTIECPECTGWDEDKRDELLRSATRDRAEKPSIRMADLSNEEKDLVAQWRVDHPTVHELTLLTWIEGRRYNPRDDQEFLADARKRFKKWQFLRYAVPEGPVPSRIQHALDTGDTSHLTKPEIEYYQNVRGNG